MVLRARAVCLAEWRADEPCTARGALASPPLALLRSRPCAQARNDYLHARAVPAIGASI
jgi:hypothetical protein